MYIVSRLVELSCSLVYFNFLYFIIVFSLHTSLDMDSEIDLNNDDNSSVSESDVEEAIELNFDFPDADDDEATADDPHNSEDIWGVCDGRTLHKFTFQIPNAGFITTNDALNASSTPIEFYNFFITDAVISNIVANTNIYVERKIIVAIKQEIEITLHSFLAVWKETNADEIWRFIAILVWIGLDQKPYISDYWSRNYLYANKMTDLCNISRMRFQSLLTFFHFSNNEENTENEPPYSK